VVLTWRTGGERRVLGFNVFRTGKKVNPSLVRAPHPEAVRGGTYRLLDRHAATGFLTYRLQIVRADGSRSWIAAAHVKARNWRAHPQPSVRDLRSRAGSASFQLTSVRPKGGIQ
jgi:hypothetical protein